MGYLQGFTITVVTVAFLCFFCEAMAPDGSFGKYTALVTGLVVSLAIAHAFLQIQSVDFTAFEVPQAQEKAPERNRAEDVIAAQFAKNLAMEVEQGLLTRFGETAVVEVDAVCRENEVTIEKLSVKNTKIETSALVSFVTSAYGIVPDCG